MLTSTMDVKTLRMLARSGNSDTLRPRPVYNLEVDTVSLTLLTNGSRLYYVDIRRLQKHSKWMRRPESGNAFSHLHA